MKRFIRRAAQKITGKTNDIPESIPIGTDFQLRHHGIGVVINRHTRIGNRVTIFHNVTIGRADAGTIPLAESSFEEVVVGDDVVIYPGAVVVGGSGVTTIADGTIIGANAVLLSSTGPDEIWAGNPARKVGLRPDRRRA